jgi:hypothetical protein
MGVRLLKNLVSGNEVIKVGGTADAKTVRDHSSAERGYHVVSPE